MKILNMKVYDPNGEEIRNVDFNSSGASIIFGKITQPAKKKKTTNSIGKTLFLKFIAYIMGKKEKKTDFSDKIYGWSIEATVEHKEKEYNVKRTLGDSKSIKIDGENYNYNKYLKFFDIEPKQNAKQILLKRRQNIISDVNIKPTKEETITILHLLKLNNIIELFENMRRTQEKVKAIKDYSQKFKDTLSDLKEREFLLEQEKNKKQRELSDLSKRIETLKIADDSIELVKIHSEKSYQLKILKLQQENLRVKIKHLNEMIEDMKNMDLSSSDVIKIYNIAKVDIPDMVKRTMDEVQTFYDSMFSDKIESYLSNVNEYKKQIEHIEEKIKELAPVVDDLAFKIANNNLFKEAMNIYQLKNAELSNIESEYNKTIGAISNLSEKKNLENEINQNYIVLEEQIKQYDVKINKYRKYIFDLVNEIYGDDSKAFFDISVSSSSRRVESSPIVFELNLTGEFGEGVSAVRNLLIDLLIFFFNTNLQFLVQDSACFEGIDKRQLSTLLTIIDRTAVEIDKQYIFSINEYHIEKNDEDLQELIKNRTVLELSEDNTLLKFKF